MAKLQSEHLPVMQAYKAYYKQFKKTYHVQQQVESIVSERHDQSPALRRWLKPCLWRNLKNMLLTAGHDLDELTAPISIDVADGSEVYTRINGQEQILKAG